MTKENEVSKMKKRIKFFKSLRFRILTLNYSLNCTSFRIVTYTMLHNYQIVQFPCYGDVIRGDSVQFDH